MKNKNGDRVSVTGGPHAGAIPVEPRIVQLTLDALDDNEPLARRWLEACLSSAEVGPPGPVEASILKASVAS